MEIDLNVQFVSKDLIETIFFPPFIDMTALSEIHFT